MTKHLTDNAIYLLPSDSSFPAHFSVLFFNQIHGIYSSVFLSFETGHKVDVDNFFKSFIQCGRLVLVFEVVKERGPYFDMPALGVNDLPIDVVVVGLLEGGIHDETPDWQSSLLLGNTDKLASGLLVHMSVIYHHALFSVQGSLN